jgi:hypothetical protein
MGQFMNCPYTMAGIFALGVVFFTSPKSAGIVEGEEHLQQR